MFIPKIPRCFFQIVTFGCGAEGRGYLVLWFKNESVIPF